MTTTALRFTAADRAALIAILEEAGDVLTRDQRVLDHTIGLRLMGAVGATLEGLAEHLTAGESIAHYKPHLREALDRWQEKTP